MQQMPFKPRYALRRDKGPRKRARKHALVAKLADRYRELMALRREGLRRYRANEFSTISGPPCRIFFPGIGVGDQAKRRTSVGPLGIFDRPPLWSFVERVLISRTQPARILEIGPGAGLLAQYLLGNFGDRILSYVALERDQTFEGPYERVAGFQELKDPVDLVIASEVAEHMSADDWYEYLVHPLSGVLRSDATMIMSVPNPTTPGGIARDVTHVQNYPWYDLYAMLRLEFAKVDVHRAYYVWSGQRLVTLLPRLAICPLIELDWCDTLVCVASGINAHR